MIGGIAARQGLVALLAGHADRGRQLDLGQNRTARFVAELLELDRDRERAKRVRLELELDDLELELGLDRDLGLPLRGAPGGDDGLLDPMSLPGAADDLDGLLDDDLDGLLEGDQFP